MLEWKEPAEPSPLRDILRHARALADAANADVALEDLPAFMMAMLLAAAGECGMDALKPMAAGGGKTPSRYCRLGLHTRSARFA
jgi:hypothetical protein